MHEVELSDARKIVQTVGEDGVRAIHILEQEAGAVKVETETEVAVRAEVATVPAAGPVEAVATVATAAAAAPAAPFLPGHNIYVLYVDGLSIDPATGVDTDASLRDAFNMVSTRLSAGGRGSCRRY